MTVLGPPPDPDDDLLKALDFSPDLDADQLLREHLVEQFDQNELQERLAEAKRFDKEFSRMVRDDQRAQDFLTRIQNDDENDEKNDKKEQA